MYAVWQNICLVQNIMMIASNSNEQANTWRTFSLPIDGVLAKEGRVLGVQP
jgi:hypothetical protein